MGYWQASGLASRRLTDSPLDGFQVECRTQTLNASKDEGTFIPKCCSEDFFASWCFCQHLGQEVPSHGSDDRVIIQLSLALHLFQKGSHTWICVREHQSSNSVVCNWGAGTCRTEEMHPTTDPRPTHKPNLLHANDYC